MEDNEGFEGINETVIESDESPVVPKFDFVPTMFLLFMAGECFRINDVLGYIAICVTLLFCIYPFWIVWKISRYEVV
jgi:hypothetical protein